MNEGRLIWDANAQRPDIMYNDGGYYGGLHCGNTLEAFIRGKWLRARIECRTSDDTWYLTGIENGGMILWLTVRN
jgi:hypothetical protein